MPPARTRWTTSCAPPSPTATPRSTTPTSSRSCSPGPRCCRPRRRAGRSRAPRSGRCAAAVERAVDEKALRPDADTALVSLTLWTTVHGWVALQLRGFLPPGADDRCEDAVRALLAALGLDGAELPVARVAEPGTM